MNSKVFFLPLKFLQAAYKNAKFYLAVVLFAQLIGKAKKNLSDETVDILIYLSFISLFTSGLFAWLFITDFAKSQKWKNFLSIPLYISGMTDFYFILSDALCLRPHNSIRFNITNIMTVFCFPAYIILVILIDFLGDGIDKQIISVVVLLSSLNEFFIYVVYGMKTASKINSQNNYYMVLQFLEMLCTLSFLGLIIINIRFSLSFLIAYFCIIFVSSFMLPILTNSFIVNGQYFHWFKKTLMLTSLWICTYQPCINKIEFRKKAFSSITNKNNKFLVTFKILFYEFAFGFFVASREEIYNQFDSALQIQALFVIACISQIKLIIDVAYSFFLLYGNKQEVVITDQKQLTEFIAQISNKKDNSHIKRISINLLNKTDSESTNILKICLFQLENAEVVINNTNQGRFFYDEGRKYQCVKLDQIKSLSYKSIVKLGEESAILKNVFFLNMYIPSPPKTEEEQVLTFLNIIFNSNIIHFDLQFSKNNTKPSQFHPQINDYKSDIVGYSMQYLIFKTFISQYIPINPQLVLFDLHDK